MGLPYHIECIFKERKIVDFLESRGIVPSRQQPGKLVYRCPLHTGDNDPSFIVYLDNQYQNYFCYGCLEENELIHTQNGLRRIIDIELNDRVLDKNGDFSRVLYKKESYKNVFKLKLNSFKDPLLITKDHICIYVKENDILSCLPYINFTEGRLKFSNKAKRRHRSKKYLNKLKFSENTLDSLKSGDFLAFPVIPKNKRKSIDLYVPNILKINKKGPKPKMVTKLVANKNVSRLCGLYLAEGSISSYGRALRFTFNINEIETLAKDTKRIIEQEFGLKAIIKDRGLYNNTCEVDCCSVSLVQQMSYWFGNGSSNKKIPGLIFNWPIDLQQALFDGYMDGDGNKSKNMVSSVSKNLSYSIFNLSIQLKLLPSLNVRRARSDRNGVHHKKYWYISYSQKERLNGFYEKIDEVDYYLIKIKEIKDCKQSRKVVDIEVENSNSFVTKLGLVHNCKSGGNIINLLSALDGISLREATKRLVKGINIDEVDVMNSLVNAIEEGTIIDNDNSIEELILIINHICKRHFEELD